MQTITTLFFCLALACFAVSIVLACIATSVYLKDKGTTRPAESPLLNRFIIALSAASWTDPAVRDRAIESIKAACADHINENFFAQKLALFAVNHSLAGALRAAARLNPSKNFRQGLEQCASVCEAGNAVAYTDAQDCPEEVEESALDAAAQAKRTSRNAQIYAMALRADAAQAAALASVFAAEAAYSSVEDLTFLECMDTVVSAAEHADTALAIAMTAESGQPQPAEQENRILLDTAEYAARILGAMKMGKESREE